MIAPEKVKLAVGLIRAAPTEAEACESLSRILEGLAERIADEQPKTKITAASKLCKECDEPIKLCAKCFIKGRADSLARKAVRGVGAKAIDKAPDAIAWLNRVLFSED